MTGVLMRSGEDTEGHREDGHVKMEGEVGVMQCLGPPEAGRCKILP